MGQLWTPCCAVPPDVKQSYLSSSLFMGPGSEVAPQETSQSAMLLFEQSIIGCYLHSKWLENLPELYNRMAALKYVYRNRQS